jgi:hypothetical protein
MESFLGFADPLDKQATERFCDGFPISEVNMSFTTECKLIH